MVKYGMGGLIVLLLICIVWFPLLFMSLIKSVAGVVNRPLDVSVTITLGGFQVQLPAGRPRYTPVPGPVALLISLSVCLSCRAQPIFTMSAQQNQLKDLTEEDFAVFSGSYSYTPVGPAGLLIRADPAGASLTGLLLFPRVHCSSWRPTATRT